MRLPCSSAGQREIAMLRGTDEDKQNQVLLILRRQAP
jgi:hypothetical protein